MTDFLDEKRQEITDRLKELKPAVDEYNRLEAAASALQGVGGASATATAAPRRRGPGRPRGSVNRKAAAAHGRPAKATRKKAGRPEPANVAPDGAKAAARAPPRRSSFVQGQPGITIPELAAKMGIKQNYLYRVLPGLEQENKVNKKGRGWHPKG